MQKYIEQSRASSCVDILYRAKTLTKEHEQHPTMDKQDEGIGDPAEAGDPGRHERLVTVEEFGKQESLHKGKKDVLFLVPKIIRNGLKEVASYPENSSLNI
jgi:hypothetical protein